MSLEIVRHGEAIHLRHSLIQQDDIKGFLFMQGRGQAGDRGSPTLHQSRLRSIAAQHFIQHAGGQGAIIHHQNAQICQGILMIGLLGIVLGIYLAQHHREPKKTASPHFAV